jgi:hypothetical protein
MPYSIVIGRFVASRGAQSASAKPISPLDTTNRPPTITQMVCVTIRVTKASPSPFHYVRATEAGAVWFCLKVKALQVAGSIVSTKMCAPSIAMHFCRPDVAAWPFNLCSGNLISNLQPSLTLQTHHLLTHSVSRCLLPPRPTYGRATICVRGLFSES